MDDMWRSAVERGEEPEDDQYAFDTFEEANEFVREEYAPSAKLIYVTLRDAQEPMTLSELSDETLLVKRTARHGLSQLEDDDLAYREPYWQDARKHQYGLNIAEFDDGSDSPFDEM